MTRLISWILLLGLVGGYVTVAWSILRARAEAGREMPGFSVHSSERNGLAEAARLLRELGWQPKALTRPIQQARHVKGLLILVEPEGTQLFPGMDPELPDADVRGLLRWVEQGNALLLAGRHATGLHQEMRIGVRTDEQAAEAETRREATVSEAGGYTQGIDRLEVEGADTLLTSEGLPLWWLGPHPAAVVVRRGRGQVIVVADPTLLTRRGLNARDNVFFLVNVARLHAREGRVWFDEYHHGLRSGEGFWGYLHHNGQQWLLLPVLLAVLGAVWSVAVRLGPAVPTPRERRADAVDYASALAQIYCRAGVRQRLARSAVRDFLAALTRHLRLRPTALPAEILKAWQQQAESASGAAEPERVIHELRKLLRGVTELRKGEVSDRRLLAQVQAMDRFRSEVLRGNTR